MITKDEVEAKAEEFGLHVANIERDYVFGWLLAGIYGVSLTCPPKISPAKTQPLRVVTRPAELCQRKAEDFSRRGPFAPIARRFRA